MEIKSKYLSKYLHNIAVEQLEEEYANKGYSVSREEIIGMYTADLVARRGNEQIVIEVKSGESNAAAKTNMMGLSKYIRQLGGYKFLVVLAFPPKDKKLEVQQIEQVLDVYMRQEQTARVQEDGTVVTPKQILDIDIDEMVLAEGAVHVKGIGVVQAELLFAEEPQKPIADREITTDNFPLAFEVDMIYDNQKNLVIKKVYKFNIDTSNYY